MQCKQWKIGVWGRCRGGSLARIALWALLGLAALPPPAQAFTIDDDIEGIGKENALDALSFAIGNAQFVLFHEAGHMLIAELDLPVLGREEDAVDMLATLLQLESETEEADQALVDSVDGWTLSSDTRLQRDETEDLSGAHGLDMQRAYMMACLMAGKDPERFAETIAYLELTEERLAQCPDEYDLARRSWERLLSGHAANRRRPTQLDIVYREPTDSDLDGYVVLVKEAALLERVAEVLRIFALKDGITIAADECGEANAYWNPNDREITICYELVQDYTWMLAEYFRQQR